ncbi:MAG: chromate resistance protein [Chloroflexi bacterium]|nr:chromate resistance protein [Chloroflexota bacterium]
MKWLTRERIRMDRVASAWLIKRFIDPAAEFIFAAGNDAAEQAARLAATPFVVPRAELSRQGDRITFDVILAKYNLGDPALRKMADIMRAADVSAQRGAQPESEGVRAIVHGFFLLDLPDPQALDLQLPALDALYRYCQEQTAPK